jgi:Predicted oxidoreductases of the aldo/keto reductase family
MIYKEFKEKMISHLGFGAMRFPTKDGHIDEEESSKMIDYAYENGINYFDTAYGYHGGESETFIGKALAKYPRDTWYLASKMPGHMMTYKDGVLSNRGYMAGLEVKPCEAIFEEQLKKCGVEYFDFYLLHNLCETSYDFYTNEDLAVVDYLVKQKEAGRIKHLGMSAHGSAEIIDKFLSENDCIEFVQIQLNYLDWFLQDAGKKHEVITKHGIPIIVMEPLRGGKLASLGEKQDAMLKETRPEDSIASWALRYLQSLPNILVILSGMSTMEQLQDNILTMSKDDPITSSQQELLDKAVEDLMDLVPCTSCRYCCDNCPQNLDIPKLIGHFNESNYEWSFSLSLALDAMSEDEKPAACIGCGACSIMCPQNIDIPSVLSEFAKKIEERKK